MSLRPVHLPDPEPGFRARARRLALAHKLRMLRGELAFRLVGKAADLWRTEAQPLLWPAFAMPADAGELERVRAQAWHYLRGLDTALRYFTRQEGRLTAWREGPAGPLCEPAAVAEETAEQAARRARRLLTWRLDGRPRALSLRPYLYAVADLPDHGESHEWLRLLADLHPEGARQAGAALPAEPLERIAILGSGPSIARFAADQDRFDGAIAMNTAVCEPTVQASRKVVAVCALDPDVFGPQEAMRPFWDATWRVLRATPALFVTARRYAPFVALHLPAEFRGRFHYADGLAIGALSWRSRFMRSGLRATGYGNVLTDLALPLAAALSPDITLYGCDGRSPANAGANFDKADQHRAFDQAHERERPGKYGYGFMDEGVSRFYCMTRVVVDECLAGGARIRVRVPSHNLGLQHLPSAEAER